MPSPFPGMDPWLERPMLYPGFHNNFLTYLQGELNRHLPPGFAVSSQTRVYVDPELSRHPDVGVYGPAASGGTVAAAAAVLERVGMLAAAAEPVPDLIEEVYLEVLTGEDDRLVTAIELLSPSNKQPGEGGRTSYLQKQDECRAAGVNLVEIDLVRGGRHTTAVPEHRLRAVAPSGYDYHVCVMLTGERRELFVAPFRLADRLPVIGVPLTHDVEPVTVDLQAVFDRCYDDGGFARLMRYGRRDPEPPLAPEQRAWADAVLREKGLIP